MRVLAIRPWCLGVGLGLLLAPGLGRAEDNGEDRSDDGPAEQAALESRAPEDLAVPMAAATDEEGPDADGPAMASVPPVGDPAPAPWSVPDLSFLSGDPLPGVPNSGFGWRDDPIRHYRRYHSGTDYRAPRGTPVYAAGGGTVVSAKRRGGYGRMVIVSHGGGIHTRYAHLKTISVTSGQHVDAEELLGEVGSTGRTTGPHLHFEVRLDGRAVDPGLALRVGELQRGHSDEAARAAGEALRPEVQAEAVSPIDPPRGRSRGGDSQRKPARRTPPIS